jgi:hypothetical protein
MVKRIKDNNTTQKLKIEKHEPYEKRTESRCFRRVNSSYSTGGTRYVALLRNLVLITRMKK